MKIKKLRKKIKRFWDMITSDNEKLINKGFKKWIKFEKEYPDYVSEVEQRLSAEFLEVYKAFSFHDFEINSIEYNLSEKTVKICLYDVYKDYGEDLHFVFTYKNVSDFYADVSCNKWNAEWLSDFLEISGKKKMKHRIMLTNGNSIIIKFELISIEKIDRSSKEQ